jgi:hypothetical protein
MTTIHEIYNYYKTLIEDIKEFAYNGQGDLLTFLMCSSFIDFLVKMVYDKESKSSDYKKFIRDYLSQIDSRYKDFTYTVRNRQDLPEQMYHILRCGITHSYSLVPDSNSVSKGGRPRSIMLGQRKNSNTHFMKYDQNGYDTVIFTVEDFAEDLRKVLDKIFIDLAPNDQQLSSNILSWVNKYPPLLWKTI